MAYIQERKTEDGKTHFRVQIRLRGFPTQTATFERKTDAKLWAQQTESAMRDGRHFKTAEAKKHTLAELVDRYIRDVIPTKPKNAAATTAQLVWWKKQLGHCLLSDLTPAIIAEQRDNLLKGTTFKGSIRSPATVVRYLAALSHALTVGVKEWGWLEDSPIKKVSKPKEPRGRVRFLDEDERTALLKACKESSSPYLYIVVVIALSCGLRRGELMSLRWENIDLFKGRITLHETKNDERRVVPLRGHALELLKAFAQARHQNIGLLFPSKENPQKPIDLRFPWEQALKKAGIENYKFHDNRHSCASALLMNQASLPVIAEVLGHKTLSMVKRYSHLSETHTANIVESMNQRIFCEQS
jgi:integrase